MKAIARAYNDMTTFADLKDYADRKGFRFIMAADAETVTHKTVDGEIVPTIAPGGVATALDAIVKAFRGVYIGRAKTEEDLKVVDGRGTMMIDDKYKLSGLKLRLMNWENITKDLPIRLYGHYPT